MGSYKCTFSRHGIVWASSASAHLAYRKRWLRLRFLAKPKRASSLWSFGLMRTLVLLPSFLSLGIVQASLSMLSLSETFLFAISVSRKVVTVRLYCLPFFFHLNTFLFLVWYALRNSVSDISSKTRLSVAVNFCENPLMHTSIIVHIKNILFIWISVLGFYWYHNGRKSHIGFSLYLSYINRTCSLRANGQKLVLHAGMAIVPQTPRRAAGSWSPCIRYSVRERRMKSRNATPFRPAPPRLRCCRGHPVFSRQYASTDYHSRTENDHESPPGKSTNCSGISSFVQSIRNNWFGLTYLL